LHWVETGVFGGRLETLAEMVTRGISAVMIDRTVARAHHCAVGEKNGIKAQGLGRSCGGFGTKLYARCDGHGRPLGFVLTPGHAHDVRGFGPLFRMLRNRIDALLVDKGCLAPSRSYARHGRTSMWR